MAAAAGSSDIGQFIQKYFKVEYKSPGLSDPGQAKFVLLSDIHGQPIYSRVNSLFVNTCGGKRDCVLIEGVKSMKPISPADSRQSARLRSSIGRILGWDLDDLASMVGKELCPEDLMRAQVRCEQILEELWGEGADVGKLQQEYFELKQMVQERALTAPAMMSHESLKIETRNRAMVETLKAAGMAYERVFLIGGAFHLVKSEGFDVNLDEVYDFLRDKEAVILSIASDKLGNALPLVQEIASRDLKCFLFAQEKLLATCVLQ